MVESRIESRFLNHVHDQQTRVLKVLQDGERESCTSFWLNEQNKALKKKLNDMAGQITSLNQANAAHLIDSQDQNITSLNQETPKDFFLEANQPGKPTLHGSIIFEIITQVFVSSRISP